MLGLCSRITLMHCDRGSLLRQSRTAVLKSIDVKEIWKHARQGTEFPTAATPRTELEMCSYSQDGINLYSPAYTKTSVHDFHGIFSQKKDRCICSGVRCRLVLITALHVLRGLEPPLIKTLIKETDLDKPITRWVSNNNKHFGGLYLPLPWLCYAAHAPHRLMSKQRTESCL